MQQGLKVQPLEVQLVGLRLGRLALRVLVLSKGQGLGRLL